jgi:hypothetical protein
VAGSVPVRIDADDDAFIRHPSLLEIVPTLQAEAGLLALVVNVNESRTLIARVEDKQIIVDADAVGDANDTDDAGGAKLAGRAVAAVYRLLNDTGIFDSSEMAGL